MAAPLIPWEPCNIPEEIQAELNRRRVNRSFVFTQADKGEWNSETGDWQRYRGPMSPWVRFCSNGQGREKDKYGNPLTSDKIKPGFVFFGGKNFYNGYGFNNLEGSPSIIGYVPDKSNRTHTINNDLNTSDYPIHVPPPEIERIQVTIQKEHYRRAMVEWVCFSKAQLEYMTPYFLVPGLSCIVEWGWNHYDPSSLLDLTDTGKLQQIYHNPYPLYTEHILRSRGNYDVLFGIITHFEWSVEGNKFKCKTEVTSKDRIYSGLVIDASMVDNKKNQTGQNEDSNPLDTYIQFVDKALPQFKSVNTNKDPASIPLLAKFISYLKKKYPDRWKEYVYGVFYGRDMEDTKSALQDGANKKLDFDYKSKNADTWINLGLLIESINFHSAPLTGMANKEMFHIDIDDVIVGAHPNLISSDGTVCLIPNAEAPKYFYGKYGPLNILLAKSSNYKPKDFEIKLKPSTNPVTPKMTREEATKNGKLADYRVSEICHQTTGTYRDDLDEIINRIRYENPDIGAAAFEFPFMFDQDIVPGSKPYPRRYSGYLKNIYVNVNFVKSLLNKSDEIKTYPQLVEKIMNGISVACGNFWDFRLIDVTGRDGQPADAAAGMKIVDYKFMAFANRGTPYSFDYFDADSLLLGLGFKPTISNAQAIRTMFAQTNNPDKDTTLTNGTNELLDYHFNDRLVLSEDRKDALPPINRDSSGFKETMRELQQIDPINGCYQITNKKNGQIITRRLVLPADDVLQRLLDDNDEENNPKYTGIMPGIQANFTIQGIGGLRTFMMFLVRNLPEPYSHLNIIFRIVDVQESLEAGKWTTTITAGIIPLREHIKKRLGIGGKTT